MKEQNERRGFWWTGTARHVWRMFFAIRDLRDDELTPTECHLRQAAEDVYSSLNPDEKDCVRFYYYHNRPVELVAADLALLDVVQVCKLLRRVEKQVAKNLQLLPPD